MARARGHSTRMNLVPWDENLESLHTVLSAEDEVVPRLTLTEALGAMSPKHREALELVYLQGFSLEEVAQILGIPLGTVKSRINAARQTLFRALDLADTREEKRS